MSKARRSRKGRVWGLIFFLDSGEEKSQDDTILIGQAESRAWLRDLVSVVWMRSFPDKRLFNLTYSQVRTGCLSALRGLHLHDDHFGPQCFRNEGG